MMCARPGGLSKGRNYERPQISSAWVSGPGSRTRTRAPAGDAAQTARTRRPPLAEDDGVWPEGEMRGLRGDRAELRRQRQLVSEVQCRPAHLPHVQLLRSRSAPRVPEDDHGPYLKQERAQ